MNPVQLQLWFLHIFLFTQGQFCFYKKAELYREQMWSEVNLMLLVVYVLDFFIKWNISLLKSL